MLLMPVVLCTQRWETQWQHEAIDYNQCDLLHAINELDYEHKVVIDITASEAI